MESTALIPARYFVLDYDSDDGLDYVEVSRAEWESTKGPISYQRHTMHLNGVNQICLQKGLSDA